MKHKQPKQLVPCQFCSRPFHSKGVKVHEKKCPNRNNLTSAPTTYTFSEMSRQKEESFKAGQDSMKHKFTDVQIKALEAAAKAVDAIAHMVGELH